MRQIIQIWALGIIFSLVISCQKEEDSSSLSVEQRANQFIEKSMKSIYLWADQIKNVKADLNKSPQEFLKSIRYNEDIWSYLEEDATISRSIVDGKEKTFGYKIQFYKLSDDVVVGMILYVYKNSPADKVGLKRGDLIVTNNGELLTEGSYGAIMNDETVTLRIGKITNNAILVVDRDYQLTKATIDLNPILLDTVLHVDQKKVGYLVYTQFYDNHSTHLQQLSQCIRKMKSEEIDEFILDLRYNIGGAENAAKRLCSLLAPAEHVRNEDILIKKQWNPTYQKTLNSSRLITKFDATVLADNLDLQSIYVLTGKQTASASELLISGLRPYMQQVVTIGTKTHGKYVGMQQIIPTDEDLKRWSLWPVTFSFTNAQDESVKGGIAPTYTVNEYNDFLPPFGSYSDPLLKKAIALISGKQAVSSKAALIKSDETVKNWKAIDKMEVAPLLGL